MRTPQGKCAAPRPTELPRCAPGRDASEARTGQAHSVQVPEADCRAPQNKCAALSMGARPRALAASPGRGAWLNRRPEPGFLQSKKIALPFVIQLSPDQPWP